MKIEKLHKDLLSVKKKYEELKKSGINEEILLIYLTYKTKLSMKKCKEMINNIDEFYDKIVSDEVIENL